MIFVKVSTPVNPIALIKAKIVYNFGPSECNRVKVSKDKVIIFLSYNI